MSNGDMHVEMMNEVANMAGIPEDYNLQDTSNASVQELCPYCHKPKYLCICPKKER